MRAHSHAEGHWIRYDEGVREYIRHNVDDDMLSRIQRWDRDHALLVDGQPGPAQLEAPRVSYMANLTTTGRLAPELGKLVTLDLIKKKKNFWINI